MRKYEPIWIELKLRSKVKLAVPNYLHRRVIKGVMKEKDMDLGFKYQNSEADKNCWITYICEPNLIKIKLNFTITTEDIL